MAIELTTKIPATPASSDRILGLRPSGLSPEDKSVVFTVETLLGVPVVPIAATTHTLSQADHNKIFNYTAATAITVTVPFGLTLPFGVGLSQGAAGQVTLVPSGGVTIKEIDGLMSTEGDGVMIALIAFSSNYYKLFGRTA